MQKHLNLEGALVDLKYRVLSQAGDGGWSVVYKAERIDNSALVALKVRTNNSIFCSFENEFAISQKISHQRIIKFSDLILEGHTYVDSSEESKTSSQPICYLVSEFFERGDLLTYVKANGPLPESACR